MIRFYFCWMSELFFEKQKIWFKFCFFVWKFSNKTVEQPQSSRFFVCDWCKMTRQEVCQQFPTEHRRADRTVQNKHKYQLNECANVDATRVHVPKPDYSSTPATNRQWCRDSNERQLILIFSSILDHLLHQSTQTLNNIQKN